VASGLIDRDRPDDPGFVPAPGSRSLAPSQQSGSGMEAQTMDRARPTQRPAWQALLSHHQEI